MTHATIPHQTRTLSLEVSGLQPSIHHEQHIWCPDPCCLPSHAAENALLPFSVPDSSWDRNSKGRLRHTCGGSCQSCLQARYGIHTRTQKCRTGFKPGLHSPACLPMLLTTCRSRVPFISPSEHCSGCEAALFPPPFGVEPLEQRCVDVGAAWCCRGCGKAP